MRTRLFVAAAATALLPLAGCGGGAATAGTRTGTWSPAPSAPGPAAPADDPAAGPADPVTEDGARVRLEPSACARDGWDCAQQSRFDAVAASLRNRPGTMGVLVHDRRTGALWRTGATGAPMWTASTIKVAIAMALLERQRAGRIHLSGADRRAMSDMLRTSSNDAADRLWKRYDGPTMLNRFRSGYGMTGLSVVAGEDAYWRNLRCTADDLDHLMAYVLGGQIDAADRAYLVDALRTVADNQHWGVWAAGSDLKPGNKDGWAIKPDPGGEHWLVHTAGFAGPDERYVVVVMYSLPPGGTLHDGVQAVSDEVALVFGGRTPAKITMPD